MPYTESVNLQRQRIADMARSLSGSKQRLGERKAAEREAGKQRISSALGKFGEQVQERRLVKAHGEQQRLTQEAQYAPGSGYTEWENIREETRARLKAEYGAAATDPDSPYYQQSGDVGATIALFEWFDKLPESQKQNYLRMIRTGTVTTPTDDPNGLDGQSMIKAMFMDYSAGLKIKGVEGDAGDFRAWVMAEIQPMPGFNNVTDEQRKSITDALDLWIPRLFEAEVVDDDFGATKLPSGGQSERETGLEQELLQKIMAAQQKQISETGMGEEMSRAGMAKTAAIEKQWQPIIDEINEPKYIGLVRYNEIMQMIHNLKPKPLEDKAEEEKLKRALWY